MLMDTSFYGNWHGTTDVLMGIEVDIRLEISNNIIAKTITDSRKSETETFKTNNNEVVEANGNLLFCGLMKAREGEIADFHFIYKVSVKNQNKLKYEVFFGESALADLYECTLENALSEEPTISEYLE